MSFWERVTSFFSSCWAAVSGFADRVVETTAGVLSSALDLVVEHGPGFVRFLMRAANIARTGVELAKLVVAIRNYFFGDPLDRPVPPDRRVRIRVLLDEEPPDDRVRAIFEEAQEEEIRRTERERKRRSRGL